LLGYLSRLLDQKSSTINAGMVRSLCDFPTNASKRLEEQQSDSKAGQQSQKFQLCYLSEREARIGKAVSVF